jgi:hypothetical protein
VPLDAANLMTRSREILEGKPELTIGAVTVGGHK